MAGCYVSISHHWAKEIWEDLCWDIQVWVRILPMLRCLLESIQSFAVPLAVWTFLPCLLCYYIPQIFLLRVVSACWMDSFRSIALVIVLLNKGDQTDWTASPQAWILANLLQSTDLFLFMDKLMFVGPALESLKVGVGHLKLSVMRLINANKHVWNMFAKSFSRLVC